ncbi:MAG: UDP-N-acetylmuramate--L-alanine ligase [Bacillota bacterium]
MEKRDLEGKNLYFIGIGGIGMSAIAKIMLGMGYRISGSDVKTSNLTNALSDLGAEIDIGHNAAHITEDVDVVIYSSAIKEDNPEMMAAKSKNLPIYKRAEMLAFLMSIQESIGVAGAHGKTTTSGMISLMLEKVGQDPTIVIGGTLPQIRSNAKSGKGRYLVAEADESDGTFLLLHPKIAIITNIEPDHLDHYGDMDNILGAFKKYLEQIPSDGTAIVNLDCPNICSLKEQVEANYITYALEKTADYQAKDLHFRKDGISSSIYEKGILLGQLHLMVPGEHNVSNALAAIAVGRMAGENFADLADALSHFTGTGRRFEVLGEIDNIRVIDDYAHHPTEIKATVKSAREIGSSRIISVFQPHRYSRTQSMYKEFAAAFKQSDIAIINEIYPAFEKPIEGVSSQMVVDEAKRQGQKIVEYAETEEDVLRLLNKYAQAGDLVLIMGAGNIRSAGEKFLNARNRRLQ